MEYLYVPEDNLFMAEAARLAREESTERNNPTGSVVVTSSQIIGRGASQAAIKNRNLAEFHRKHFCVRRFLKIKTGTKYWLCPGCARYHNHSEPRAINDAKKNYSDRVRGADLYLWGHYWCCEPCQKAIREAGIVNVYLLEGSDTLFRKS